MVFAGRAVQVPLWPGWSPFRLHSSCVLQRWLRPAAFEAAHTFVVQYTKCPCLAAGGGGRIFLGLRVSLAYLRYVALCCSASQDVPMWYGRLLVVM
jgi:hypothetical protein